MIKKDKDKIKEMASNRVEALCLRQNERFRYVDNCVAAKICPNCGSDIFVNIGDIDKEIGRVPTISECSTCEWKNYEFSDRCF